MSAGDSIRVAITIDEDEDPVNDLHPVGQVSEADDEDEGGGDLDLTPRSRMLPFRQSQARPGSGMNSRPNSNAVKARPSGRWWLDHVASEYNSLLHFF